MSFHAQILAHRAPHVPVHDPVLRAPGVDVPHTPGIGIPHAPGVGIPHAPGVGISHSSSVGILHAPGVDILALLELVFLMLPG